MNADNRLQQRLLLAAKEAKAPFFVGVDVGGTSIKIGVVDDYGRSIDSGEIDCQGGHRSYVTIKTEPNPQSAAELISVAIHDLLRRLRIEPELCHGIGLGIPGTMDPVTRKLRQLPNLQSWQDFALVDTLAEISGFPVLFCNDANAAAYGEYWVGSASGKPSLALLTLGTGIGCGIIIGGKAIVGTDGFGGECGHLVIDCAEDAIICGCGQRGHLEAYASATAVARRTIDLTDRRESSIRPRITPETRLGEIAKIVYQEAENGDPLAMEIILDTAKYLALGIVSISHTVDPACIVLGGAMTFGGSESHLGRRFLEEVKTQVYARAFKPIATYLAIDFAMLGPEAGYIGAAGLAREEYLKSKQCGPSDKKC